jgi:hypothetical protein
MFYNYVQAPDGVFSRYLDGYTVTYFNEDVNCRPKDLTPEQALELGVFPLQIVTPPYHDPLTQALVLADAVLVNGVWTQVYEVVELSPEQIAYNEEQARQANKTQATALLQQTDWTCTVDITNPQYSNPYLANQDEFLTYRSQVRQVAVNPPVEPVTFPPQPDEVWASA